MDPPFPLAGFVVGTAVGLSGVGGNALLAPVLILLLGVPPTLAVGTDLAYSVRRRFWHAFFMPAKKMSIGRHGMARRRRGAGDPRGPNFHVLRAHIEHRTQP